MSYAENKVENSNIVELLIKTNLLTDPNKNNQITECISTSNYFHAPELYKQLQFQDNTIGYP